MRSHILIVFLKAYLRETGGLAFELASSFGPPAISTYSFSSSSAWCSMELTLSMQSSFASRNRCRFGLRYCWSCFLLRRRRCSSCYRCFRLFHGGSRRYDRCHRWFRSHLAPVGVFARSCCDAASESEARLREWRMMVFQRDCAGILLFHGARLFGLGFKSYCGGVGWLVVFDEAV